MTMICKLVLTIVNLLWFSNFLVSKHASIYLSGDKFWTFNGNSLIPGHPKTGIPLTELGLPADVKKIDAVFVWGFNNRTYIISGDMYWKLNEKNDFIEPDYPRDMSIWRKVPVPLDSAFKYWDGKSFYHFLV